MESCGMFIDVMRAGCGFFENSENREKGEKGEKMSICVNELNGGI